jgi:hypothetical protein
MNVRVKEKYLISQLELHDLDSLVVPPFSSFLVKLGTVASLLPPFLKFGHQNFPFCSIDLEVHVPLLNSPESFVFKFYGNMTGLPVDLLIWCHTDRCFEDRSVCPHSFTKLAVPASAHSIHRLLKDILDLLV